MAFGIVLGLLCMVVWGIRCCFFWFFPKCKRKKTLSQRWNDDGYFKKG